MEIIKVKLKDITCYENNAKKHPVDQINQIKKSIKEFGNNDPIAIDENNVIIEGHGRYYALKELGYEEAECIRLVHMTEEQKKAYILVHNKLTMNTDFDFNILDAELSNLSLDMSEFGFSLEQFNSDDFGEDFELSNSDTPQTRTITLSLNEEQYAIAMAVIDYVQENDLIAHDFGNHNKTSNALFEGVYQWAEQKKLL